MPVQHPFRLLAIICMVWSTISGIAELCGFRLIQVTMGEGHAGSFPYEFIGVYVGVEFVLAIALAMVLRKSKWSALVLYLIFLGTFVGTFVGLRQGAYTPDFTPNAVVLELIWLSPWLGLIRQLRKSS